MTTAEFSSDDFSQDSFWKKVTKYAKKAGREVVQKALEIYYITIDEKTPMKVKAIGASALTYFVCPIDLIPDVAPVVGYSDDLGVLVAAAVALTPYFTDEIRQKANQTFEAFFD
ncbi:MULTISPECIES: YkvA family protein [Pseudomonas]|jgi:uncharacterized membrane protein YkvA (DUF1232 family)|uniref:YkvA family protein n=1 Tax=Pseudomonas TaxID=286 RepID=UPI00226E4D04|nr:DUF1232 domain-containing protein [Pseudomonas putida]WAB98136.1 DUF1232 domain-containing protein [Pseudomonas putida]